jgi:hypothetical protein
MRANAPIHPDRRDLSDPEFQLCLIHSTFGAQG